MTIISMFTKSVSLFYYFAYLSIHIYRSHMIRFVQSATRYDASPHSCVCILSFRYIAREIWTSLARGTDINSQYMGMIGGFLSLFIYLWRNTSVLFFKWKNISSDRDLWCVISGTLALIAACQYTHDLWLLFICCNAKEWNTLSM